MPDTQETSTPLLLLLCFDCREVSLAVAHDRISDLFEAVLGSKWIVSVITPPGVPLQTVLLCEKCSHKHYTPETLAEAMRVPS